jgi:hypothetical protein
MTPDVNVLIAAFRRDHQHHAVALQRGMADAQSETDRSRSQGK